MSEKLADILARKKAARAAAAGDNNSAGPETTRSPSLGRRQPSAYNDNELESEEDYLSKTLGGTALGGGGGNEQYERQRSGISEVSAADLSHDMDKIAQGGLGVLYRGEWRGCQVAIKKPVDPRAASDPSLKADFQKEVDVLGTCRHPNIVLLMGACLRPPNLCMVFEWCAGGTLRSLIYSKQNVRQEQQLRIAVGVTSALTFLHTAVPAIIHRDIKPENILLDETLSVPKLCDFGLSILVSEACDTRADAGTPMYMAPELYRGETVSLAADVYAMGVTMCEMLSREAPFGGMDVSDIRAKVTSGARPNIPVTCPRNLQILIKDMWSHTLSARPSMAECLSQFRAMLGACIAAGGGGGGF